MRSSPANRRARRTFSSESPLVTQAAPFRRLFEVESDRAQPRVDGVLVFARRVGDLLARHLVELGQDEDRSLVLVEGIDPALHEARGFDPRRVLVRSV